MDQPTDAPSDVPDRASVAAELFTSVGFEVERGIDRSGRSPVAYLEASNVAGSFRVTWEPSTELGVFELTLGTPTWIGNGRSEAEQLSAKVFFTAFGVEFAEHLDASPWLHGYDAVAMRTAWEVLGREQPPDLEFTFRSGDHTVCDFGNFEAGIAVIVPGYLTETVPNEMSVAFDQAMRSWVMRSFDRFDDACAHVADCARTYFDLPSDTELTIGLYVDLRLPSSL